jgi:hypothetical protein
LTRQVTWKGPGQMDWFEWSRHAVTRIFRIGLRGTRNERKKTTNVRGEVGLARGEFRFWSPTVLVRRVGVPFEDLPTPPKRGTPFGEGPPTPPKPQTEGLPNPARLCAPASHLPPHQRKSYARPTQISVHDPPVNGRHSHRGNHPGAIRRLSKRSRRCDGISHLFSGDGHPRASRDRGQPSRSNRYRHQSEGSP